MEWTIKQAEKATGLTVDTLRYYEKEGILTTKRRENGYRYFDENDITTLKYIVVMKYAGFTIAELKMMAKPLECGPGEDCGDVVKKILLAKINELKQAISNYHKIVKLMEESFKIVDFADSAKADGKVLDEFIDQIFNDIKKGTLFTEEGI